MHDRKRSAVQLMGYRNRSTTVDRQLHLMINQQLVIGDEPLDDHRVSAPHPLRYQRSL